MKDFIFTVLLCSIAIESRALSKLRIHLQWLASQEGILQAMRDRLTDAERDLRREHESLKQSRIMDEIAKLEKDIANQHRIVDDSKGAKKRVDESIARGLERERQLEKPVTRTKFINPPPGVATDYFQDRYFETKLICDFLKNDVQRLMTVVGRAGMGKTVMVCLFKQV
ncbi:MAG: hypothetical protein Q8O41_08120 [Candidatus Methanoperedens sp.]|nr:hypothetical protein [Candidatus Methanoperedens sp.]